MNLIRIALFFATLAISGTAPAEVSAGSMPASSLWYVHADLKQLRAAESGKQLYAWLEKEAFAEIQSETGIDVSREADTLTAFSDTEHGTVIVVDGAISKDTHDKMLAIAAAESTLDVRTYGGKTYYHSSHPAKARQTGHRSFDDLQETAFFSFDVKNKLIVASNEKQMEALLDNGGRLPSGGTSGNPLFVLSADRSFLQAGMRTDELAQVEENWNSNILKNTEQVALLVADAKEYITIEAKLVSREAMMAKALGGIVSGLLSLQALNSELDPEVQNILRNTRIEVEDKILSINAVLDPKVITAMLDD